MKIYMLVCTMLMTGMAVADECPYESPYKCKTIGYSQYQCGCGVKYSSNRGAGPNNSFNGWQMINQTPTIVQTQAYTPPRYISYGDKQIVYSLIKR